MSEQQPEKINVLVAMDFSDEIINQFREVSPRLRIEKHFPEVPAAAWAETEVLYTSSKFPQPEQAPLLRWIQTHFAGIDGAIQQRIIQAEDVLVTSSSGIHAQSIANHCLMMIMAFNNKLPQMLDFQRKGEWPTNQYEIFAPTDLSRQTLGIAGYGSIGRELARIAHALGMKVLATKRDIKRPAENSNEYSPEGSGDPNGEIPERLYPGEALASMASECDYVVITVPLTDRTRHMVDEKVLAAMKPSGVLINIARGAVVDEKALISALAAERIGGAALDVFEEEPLPSGSPLWNMENVILSPHVSGNSRNLHEKAAALFIENLQRYVEKRPLLNQLNRETGY